MITTKDLYLQNAVNAAVWYIERGEGFPRLRCDFNKLCEAWHADVFDPDDLSLDIDEITRCIYDEPWIRDIAALPAEKRTWQMIERVVEEFIYKYWLMQKEEITTKMVADVLLVADPLSRRHLLAQRVVIGSIHTLRTVQELQRLDKLMDKLAINPKLEL